MKKIFSLALTIVIILIVYGCQSIEVIEKQSSIATNIVDTTIIKPSGINSSTGYTTPLEETNDQNKSTKLYEVIKKINDSLPVYSFLLIGQNLDENVFELYKVEIYNTEEDKKVQELSFDTIEIYNNDDPRLWVMFEDINFDGYLDIMVQQCLPANGCIPYYYWLWDKKSSEYVRNEDLEQILSPTIDSKQKTIKSFFKDSCTWYYEAWYKFVDNKLIKIKDIDRKADLEKNVWDVIEKEFNEGKSKVVKQYEEKME